MKRVGLLDEEKKYRREKERERVYEFSTLLLFLSASSKGKVAPSNEAFEGFEKRMV